MPEPKGKNPFEANPELEAEAKRLGDYEIKDPVSRIQHKVGMFNLIRNARNAKQVEIHKLDEADKG